MAPIKAKGRAAAAFALVLIVCALSAMLLAGCATDQHEREATTEERDAICAPLEQTLAGLRDGDAAVIEAAFSTIWFDPTYYGVSAEAFAAAYYAGLAWEFGDVVIDEDGMAYASFTVELRPIGTALDLLVQAADAAQEAGSDMAASNYADAYFEALAADAEASGWGLESVEATIRMTQGEDGTWATADNGTFEAVLLGGYDPRQALYDE